MRIRLLIVASQRPAQGGARSVGRRQTMAFLGPATSEEHPNRDAAKNERRVGPSDAVELDVNHCN